MSVDRDIGIEYRIDGEWDNAALNRLYRASWPAATEQPGRDFSAMLSRCLGFVTAMAVHEDESALVGFVYVAWDGGQHGFLLDPTVRPDHRRLGIGTRLVETAVDLAQRRGIEWLHVDFLPELASFYARCGFRRTDAAIMRWNAPPD